MNNKSDKLPKVSLEQPPDEFVHSEREYPDDPDVQAYIYSSSPEAEETNQALRATIKQAKAKLEEEKNKNKQNNTNQINTDLNYLEEQDTPTKYSAENIGMYIQNNIKAMLNDKEKTDFTLPGINNDYISGMGIKIKNKNENKIVMLTIQGKNHPEIAIEMVVGDNEKVLNTVGQKDFVENFAKTIKDLESVFIYG